MPSVIPGPGQDPIPQTDDALLSFANNFSTTWSPATFNVVLPTAASLAALANNYSEELALAQNPSSRTPQQIAIKNTNKAALIAALRPAARSAITAYRAGIVTEAAITNLGLRIPSPPTPITAPTDAPLIDVASVAVNTVTLRCNQVVNGLPVTLRRFPYGIIGCEYEFSAGTILESFTSNRVNTIRSTTGFAAGVIVTSRARYYTRTGLVGPWSQTFTFPAMRS